MAAPTNSVAAPQNSDSSSQDPNAQSFSANGTRREGSVQQPGAPANSSVENVTSAHFDGREAIREGKQKAKAVMEAAGVNATSASNQNSPQRSDGLSKPPGKAVNGVAMTRKRSRSGSRIPAQSATAESDGASRRDRIHLETYQQRDHLHYAAMNEHDKIRAASLESKTKDLEEFTQGDIARARRMNPGSVFGYGYAGYGNGATNERPHQAHLPALIKYPFQRKRPGNRRARELRIPRKELATQADMAEELVPLRLDIEFDRIKLRDTFTWNLNDRTVPPEVFAETLVEDFNLPPETFPVLSRQVQHEIQEQLQDFYPHCYIADEAADPYLPYYAHKNDEMRILIKLDITIGTLELVDQFEWDINDPGNSPEEFARQMARDLSLSGEFVTAIAHNIREQIQLYTRSLYITNHPFDGRPIEDSDLRDGFLPSPVPSVFRPVQAAKEYGPYLYELTEADFERTELSLMREQRRQKRSVNRRGGPALPDLKDRQKTVRSLVVSSVLPGASETVEDARIYRYSRQSGRGRRSGAGRGDDGDDSDDFESEDSAPESPGPSLPQSGRTRGMRGAASAAQAAIRTNVMGRSATPEISQQLTPHHHETRTSRRTGLSHDIGREESRDPDGPPSLLLKLRIPREKYRRWNREQKARAKERELQQLQQQQRQREQQQQSHTNSSHSQTQQSNTPLVGSQSSTPARNTPQRGDMPPPPTTPGVQQQQSHLQVPSLNTSGNDRDASSTPAPTQVPPAPQQNGGNWTYTPEGRVDATNPPSGGPPPPPPPHLVTALASLAPRYPSDRFEPLMRYSPISTATNEPIKQEQLQAEQEAGRVKWQYVPKIKCNDCPGRLYNFPVENFEVHLKNRQHLNNVARRTG
ncbi:SNF5-domain-containing protein [Viridothelium virens]|uniref:SNF5-domain-containing protein n=1 Tax=Viridothelium virens TaxID=1048519 RepID=A0A6A6H595_VIRVR|nr:SNF5-domain-containing protein [Viridothelium virens]